MFLYGGIKVRVHFQISFQRKNFKSEFHSLGTETGCWVVDIMRAPLIDR